MSRQSITRLLIVSSLVAWLAAVLLVTRVCAEPVTFEWNASLTPEVAGYLFVQEGQEPVDVGDRLTHVAEVDRATTETFYVFAYTADGRESRPSNVVVLLGVVTPPADLRVNGVTVGVVVN